MRRILHVDMDAFYASVEQRDNPDLRGRPVVVGGDPDKRGVVAAASYEARTFGVRSAIPMARAVRLCPSLVIVRPDFTKYRAVSQQVFDIYRRVTPLVEPLSLDEAYLDVTENAWGETLGMNVARRLKDEIRAATGLTASAGVAPNKFLAKIASGWQKPDGLTVIAPERVEMFLQGLPVDALWGVGPVTARKLRARGIEKLVDVRTADPAVLRETVGSLAEWLQQLAQGIDDRPVVSEHEPKSSGSENTFAHDLTDLRGDSQGNPGNGLRRGGLAGAARAVRANRHDQGPVPRLHDHHAQPHRRRDARHDNVVKRALSLLEKTEAGTRPIRLLGVSVHNLASTARGAGSAARSRSRKPQARRSAVSPISATVQNPNPRDLDARHRRLAVDRHRFDLVDHVQPFDDAPEHGVLIVEPLLARQDDEEGRRRAGRILAPRHREDAAIVRRLVELGLHRAHVGGLLLVERLLPARQESALDHEAFRDAVERGAVVDAARRHAEKAAHVIRRPVGEELDRHVAHRRLDHGAMLRQLRGRFVGERLGLGRRLVADRHLRDLDALGRNVVRV